MENDYKNECTTLLGRVANSGITKEERQKVSSVTGSWCFLPDDHYVYFVLTRQLYPERLAFSCIEEARQHTRKMPAFPLGDQSSSVFKKHFKGTLENLVSKYNHPEKIDKIAEAQANVDNIQVVMTDNIQKMLANSESVENVQGKTEKMKEMSLNF
jgi:hypothetical protein